MQPHNELIPSSHSEHTHTHTHVHACAHTCIHTHSSTHNLTSHWTNFEQPHLELNTFTWAPFSNQHPCSTQEKNHHSVVKTWKQHWTHRTDCPSWRLSNTQLTEHISPPKEPPNLAHSPNTDYLTRDWTTSQWTIHFTLTEHASPSTKHCIQD